MSTPSEPSTPSVQAQTAQNSTQTSQNEEKISTPTTQDAPQATKPSTPKVNTSKDEAPPSALNVALAAEEAQHKDDIDEFRGTFPAHDGLTKEELEGEFDRFMGLSDEGRILYVRRYRDRVATFMVHGNTGKDENIRFSVRPKTYKKSELLPDGFEYDKDFVNVYESVNLHSYPEISGGLFHSLEELFKDFELSHPVIPKKDNFSQMVSRTLGGNTKLLLDSVLPGNNKRILMCSLLSMTAMNLLTKCAKFGEDEDGKANFAQGWASLESLLQTQYDLLMATCSHNVRTAKDVIKKEAGLSASDVIDPSERQQRYFQESDLAHVQLSLEQQRVMQGAVRSGDKRKRPFGFGSGRGGKRFRRGGFAGSRGNFRGNFRGRGRGRPFRGRGFVRGQNGSPSQH